MTQENTTTVVTKPAAKVVKPRSTRAAAVAQGAVLSKAVAKPAVAKVETKAAVKPRVASTAAATTTFKPKTMSLVAGLAVALSHKKLTKALGYHSKTTGTIEKLPDGKYALTALGEQAWNFQRVTKQPTLFQEVANFVKRGGPIPAVWKNQPPLEVAPGVQMPNPIFWGSFSTGEMRLAFAAIWAK